MLVTLLAMPAWAEDASPKTDDVRRERLEQARKAAAAAGAIRGRMSPEARRSHAARVAAARDAARRAKANRPPACEILPPDTGKRVFDIGESLTYDLDVMGVRAGRLSMEVARQDRKHLAINAWARSNTFFENVRKLDGRATSFTDAKTLRPYRYREDALEDGVTKWAEVVYPEGRPEVDVHYAIGKHERKNRYPMTTGAHDVISLIYYVRTLSLETDSQICLDVYGNRKVWRLRGKVEGEEWVSTPAGRFKTMHLSATAQRVDRPNYKKELHLWLSLDDRRLPVAVLGEIDLGAVRAVLADIDGPGADDAKKPNYGSSLF